MLAFSAVGGILFDNSLSESEEVSLARSLALVDRILLVAFSGLNKCFQYGSPYAPL